MRVFLAGSEDLPPKEKTVFTIHVEGDGRLYLDASLLGWQVNTTILSINPINGMLTRFRMLPTTAKALGFALDEVPNRASRIKLYET